MGRSIIVSSYNSKFLEKELAIILKSLDIPTKENPDKLEITNIDKQSIGIDQIKELIEWGKVKPYNLKNKVGIILHAELLTEQAQNSALKILEEPNESLNLILLTTSYRYLLPTILSRCELIADEKSESFSITNFTNSGFLEKMLFVRKLVEKKKKQKDSNVITEFLTNLLFYYREILLKNGSMKDISFNIKLIQTTNQMLKAKVLPKLALENLVINLNNI